MIKLRMLGWGDRINCKMEIILLNQEDIEKAKIIESKRKQRLVGKTYTKFDSEDDSFIGAIGEVAFENYLKSKNKIEGKDFSTNYDCIDPYDKWDISLGGKKIDVKTEKSLYEPSEEWFYGYPVIQKPENKDLILICIYNPKTNIVYIIGFMSGKEVKTFPKTKENGSGKFSYKIENYDIPANKLKEVILLIGNKDDR